MTPGQRYLLRTKNEAAPGKPYFIIDSVDSGIPVGSGEEIAKLKMLPPRIVVLRTINLRVDELEGQKRQVGFELDALKMARIEN